ncbi:MAG TPA: hypothetical protein VMH81_12250 [Bryobacteraceae bacterium]|nr:hypothetical protein [Bryobacteraceae bacterium]
MANEEIIERIAEVNPVWAETMREHPTVFHWRPIPFYRKFQLLSATVNLRRRTAGYRYADDGSRLFILRATPEHIYQVNQLEGLQLDPSQVPDYVRFFFDNLTGPRIAIVERPEEAPWFEPPDDDPEIRARRADTASRIHPIRVTPEGDDYRVEATGVAGSELVELDLGVKRDGHIDIRSQRTVLEDIPVVEEWF